MLCKLCKLIEIEANKKHHFLAAFVHASERVRRKQELSYIAATAALYHVSLLSEQPLVYFKSLGLTWPLSRRRAMEEFPYTVLPDYTTCLGWMEAVQVCPSA